MKKNLFLLIPGLLCISPVPLSPESSPDASSPSLCSPSGQEALDQDAFASARSEFLAALERFRSAGDRRSSSLCEFYLGLTDQLAAKDTTSPTERTAFLRDSARHYESARELGTATPALLGNLARVYSGLEEWERAESLFTKALAAAKDGDAAPLLIGRAEAKVSQGLWREAAESYRQALDLAPLDDRTWGRLFELLRRRAPDELAASLQRAIAARQTETALQGALDSLEDPEVPAAVRPALLTMVAQALAEQPYDTGQFFTESPARRLEALRRDALIGPGAAQILEIHRGQEFSPETYSWWSDNTAPTPSRVAAFQNLLRSLASRPEVQDPAQARQYLELAERLGPDPQVYGDLAVVYMAAGDESLLLQKLPAWEDALPTDSQGKAAFHTRMAQALYPSRAKKQFEEQLTNASAWGRTANDPRLLLKVGGIYQQLGRNLEAADAYLAAQRFALDRNLEAESREASERLAEISPPPSYGPSSGGTLDLAGGECSGKPRDCTKEEMRGSMGAQRLSPHGPGWPRYRSEPCAGKRIGGTQQAVVRGSGKPSVMRPALLSSLPGPSRPIPLQACRRVPLSISPEWTVSGLWDGPHLLLADPLGSRLLRYSADGVLRDVIPNRTGILSRIGMSVAGKPVLQAGPDRLIWLDDKTPSREVILTPRPGAPGTLRAMYGWTLLGEDKLLAFGDIELSGGGWVTGMARVSLQTGKNGFDLALTMNANDPRLSLYWLGHPYLTQVGGRGYFVDVREQPFALYEISDREGGARTVRRLGPLPGPLALDPLDPYLGRAPEDLTRLFQAVERASLPVGLYSRGDHLFLLSRRPGEGQNGTRWQLIRIDRELARAVETVDLPTTAHHLVAIPGAQSWAFIEKGPVEGWGRQEIHSALLIPSILIEGRSKLRGASTLQVKPPAGSR